MFEIRFDDFTSEVAVYGDMFHVVGKKKTMARGTGTLRM